MALHTVQQCSMRRFAHAAHHSFAGGAQLDSCCHLHAGPWRECRASSWRRPFPLCPRLHVSRVHARSRRAAQRTAATARRRASGRCPPARRRRRAQHAAAAAPCVHARSPQRKKNPAAAALIGRCPSAAALSLMVKVGKMFVCIETVGRVARSAAAPASVDASSVRAMVLRIIYSVSLRCPAIHVVFRKSRARALMRGCGDIMAVRGELLVAVSVAWVADLWRSAAATLLVVGVDLVLDACPSAPSLLRRLFCRTGLGSLHLLVTGARRCAGALYSSQGYSIFDLIILYIL